MRKKVIVTVLFIISLALVVILKNLSKVNGISTEILTTFILIPLVGIECIIMIVSWFSQNSKKIVVIQALLFAIVISWFIYYTMF